MRRPIRIQILIPFATVLIVSVAVMAITEAWLAAGRAERDVLKQLRSVMATIEQSSLNYTLTILDKMRGLSGAEFVALTAEGRIDASTLRETPVELGQIEAAPLISANTKLSSFPRVMVGNEAYSASRVKASGSTRVSTLVVLYPEAVWREARWTAAWPPLVVGSITVLVMSACAAWLAARLARRVSVIEQLFADIANGTFRQIPLQQSSDELDDLVASANRLSVQLADMQQTIRRTERVRLLAQLAGGLAHQLRNAVTGARMAVQIHQRRCSAGDTDSLDVALRQMSMTEEHVKRLLSLSRVREENPVPASLDEVLVEVVRLAEPVAHHAHVGFDVSTPNDPSESDFRINDGEGFKTALLNLVLNAIEAAGADGEVEVRREYLADSVRVQVIDTGAGPPAAVADNLFEPFITTKPEGVGLGLSLARQATEDLGGTLRWFRSEDRTVFEIRLPRPQ